MGMSSFWQSSIHLTALCQISLGMVTLMGILSSPVAGRGSPLVGIVVLGGPFGTGGFGEFPGLPADGRGRRVRVPTAAPASFSIPAVFARAGGVLGGALRRTGACLRSLLGAGCLVSVVLFRRCGPFSFRTLPLRPRRGSLMVVARPRPCGAVRVPGEKPCLADPRPCGAHLDRPFRRIPLAGGSPALARRAPLFCLALSFGGMIPGPAGFLTIGSALLPRTAHPRRFGAVLALELGVMVLCRRIPGLAGASVIPRWVGGDKRAHSRPCGAVYVFRADGSHFQAHPRPCGASWRIGAGSP